MKTIEELKESIKNLKKNRTYLRRQKSNFYRNFQLGETENLLREYEAQLKSLTKKS